MSRTSSGHLLKSALLALLVTPAFAQSGEQQPPPMTPEQQAEMEWMKAGTPGAPHQALASMAGTYDCKVRLWAEPGAPAAEETGTATRRMMLEGRVMVEEFSGTMMGMPFSGYGLHGYDNVTGKHWSTWTDSMSTGIMMSEGTCDAQKACTFTGSSNDPITKGPYKVRMTSRWTSPTTEVFEMFGPDKKSGQEMKVMEITYSKK